jgi:2,3-bisphosphoglycerate-independent phosphoglycerate mutase
MKIVFLFVDGVGLGGPDPSVNPCMDDGLGLLRFHENGKRVSEIPLGGALVSADACLGVEGLPQSATGQTALFTGLNASKLLNRHLPGYPNEILRNALRERSVLKRATEAGLRSAFVNAYRPLFFGLKETTKWRLSATTVATLAAGLPFFSTDDLAAKKCLYHDFTNEALVRRGFDLPLWTPEKAGKIMQAVSDSYDFLLYEYFLTDKAGHGMDRALAVNEMRKLDRFVSSLLESVRLDETLVLLTSDHGNIEDLTVKTHTRNNVPVIAWGRESERIADKVRSIADVTPALMELLADAETLGKDA